MPTVQELLSTALETHRVGRSAEARDLYQEILNANPDHADALHLLGLSSFDQGRYEEALALIGRAIERNPSAAGYHNNLGNVLQQLRRFPEALLCYERALQLEPTYAEAYSNLGAALDDLGRTAEALDCFRQALELKPDHPDSYNNLGNSFRSLNLLDDAVACYKQAIQLRPGYPDAWNNLGGALAEQGYLLNAMQCYDHVLSAHPANAKAHWNRALILLTAGNFEEGWQEYQWRWEARDVPRRQFLQPLWDGVASQGKTILLHAEQGLGDTIQFARYASLLARQGAAVVLECQPRLAPLLATLPGVASVVAAGDPLPWFDTHVPLLDVPRLLGTTLESIPAEIPYLKVDPARVDAGRLRLEAETRPKVGIAWAGSRAHQADHQRSVKLALFTPLAQFEGIAFYSLQRGEKAAELASPPPGLTIRSLEEESGDILDTAAAIMNLDLIITVDTMVAHLAAALGKPVWNLLPYLPDWRWLLESNTTPWYPTMRLYRQPEPGAWTSVMEQVAADLAAVLAANSQGHA